MTKNLMQTVVSVYPSCKANIAHNDVTLQEVFDKVKNDSILRQRTDDYRKALADQTGNRRFLPFYVTDILSPFAHPLPHDEMYAEAMWLITRTNFSYWFSLDELNDMSGYVEQFADSIAEDELIDVYFDVPRSDPDNLETRPVLFLTPSEILAKLTLWGNIKKPISIRKLYVLLDRKGFPRARNGSKGTRGYLVVELDSATVNSNRMQFLGPAVF